MEYVDIEIDDDSFDVSEEFSNKDGKGGNLDPNALMTALGGVATMVGSFGAGKRAKEQAKADQKMYASQLALAKEQNKALALQTDAMRLGQMQTPPPKQGLSTMAKVGIGVGALITAVGIFVLVKKYRK